jgi:hypothetical protein
LKKIEFLFLSKILKVKNSLEFKVTEDLVSLAKDSFIQSYFENLKKLKDLFLKKLREDMKLKKKIFEKESKDRV